VGAGGTITCSPTVADLNNDGLYEIIFVAFNDKLFVVEQDGTPYSGFPITFACNTDAMCPSPAVGNFDADDDLEIVAVATNTGVSAELYILDTDIPGGTSGQALPGWPQVLPGSSEGSPVVGDIDGDGVLDVVHNIGGGSTESPNNLYAFTATGNPIDGFPISLTAPLRSTPTITDLDLDGNVNIIHVGWDKLIHVWDMPFAYHPALGTWKTFRGGNLRDGVHRSESLVAAPEPVPPAQRFTMLPPYPNPFNPLTNVKLYVPGSAGSLQPLQVQIYDLQGRLVSTLHDGPVAAGWQTFSWDGRDRAGRQASSGLYFLRARSREHIEVRKMSLIK
jgi:hypothetical protein